MRSTRLIPVLVIGSTVLTALGLRGEGARQAAAKKAPAAAAAADDASDESQTDANKWMQIKLKASQEIFTGLTKGDAKAIEVNAARMLLLNVLEQWKDDNKFKEDSAYDAQLNAFEFATKELVRTAKADDIDGALDAYVLLSRSCVKCHQLIRDVPEAK